MKRYSTVHPLAMSFFSPKVYRDIAYSWRGACILYLLILVAITQAPNALIFHRGVRKFVRTEAPLLVAQIPRMSFKGGELTTDEKRPYEIRDPKSGDLIAIVDTSGATTSLDGRAALVLFTADQVFLRHGSSRIQVISYAKNADFTVTRGRVIRVLGWIERYAAAVLYLHSVLFVLIYRLLQALIFSLAALAFAKIVRARLSYGALYRITAAAMTPALIVGAIRNTVGAPAPAAPYALLLFLALVLGYLIFAVKACTAGEAQ